MQTLRHFGGIGLLILFCFFPSSEIAAQGCTSGDCQNGWGTYTFSTGESYTGYWIDGKRNGFGTNNFASGQKYEGFWTEDAQDGYGTTYYEDGSVYTGFWKMGTWEGYPSDMTGCVSGDCSNGYGTYVWSSGEKYIGYWQNDMRNGYGENFFTTGICYKGNWTNDKRNGYGVNKDQYGTIKDGDWVDDVFQGASDADLGWGEDDSDEGSQVEIPDVTYTIPSNKTAIEKVNNYCTNYDPYVRIFTFDETTGILTWVNQDLTVREEALLKDLDIVVEGEPDAESVMVAFKCKDASTCIYSNYVGNVESRGVTINNYDIAQLIVNELKKLKAAPGISEGLSDANKKVLEKINGYTKNYDPYLRIFSYNEVTNEITFQEKQYSTYFRSNLANLELSINGKDTDKEVYIKFRCKSGSNCLFGKDGSGINETAITITNYDIASLIIAELGKLKPR